MIRRSTSLATRSRLARAFHEVLEERRLLAVTLTNGLATNSPDRFVVVVDGGGDTNNSTYGSPGTSTVFDYSAYLDIGATAVSLGSVASAPVLGADGIARSNGTVPIPGGGTVTFQVESSIAPGTKAFVNKFTFSSTGFDLRNAKFFEYLDADIGAVSDDVLTVKGTVASASDPLLLTTIDPATNIRQAQRNGAAGVNTSLTGWGAQAYPSLSSAISGGSYDAAPNGTNTLPATNVAGIGAAFGPRDITTALEYGFTSATGGSLNTVLGIDFQLASAPEIDVRGTASTSILTGDTTPAVADGTDFGSIAVGANATNAFSVANIGNQILNLTGSPRVIISGANAGDFTVTTQPGATVAGGASSPFSIRFAPTATGARTATVTIASNDSNEGSYTFSIRGTATAGTVVAVAKPGGPYSAAEGSPLSLNGSTSTGNGALTYTWDLNGDGTFGDATGATPTVSAATLRTLGLGDGPTSKTISLRITDSTGASNTATASLTITNVAPSASAGPDKVVAAPGTAVTLNGTATDPAGTLDPLTLSWVVKNSGGTTVASGSGAAITFTPSAAGVYTATLTATDGDGGTGTDSATITVGSVTPPPTGDGPAITTFTLVNADTDTDIMTLVDGATLDRSALPARVNVRANTTLGARGGSVKFGYDVVSGAFNANFATELGAPYALFGDFPSGDYNGKLLGLGAHLLTATPSTWGGTLGTAKSVRFTVVDGTAASAVTSFTLVNAGTRANILDITDGLVISLASLGTSSLNIRANVTGTVESVRLLLDGTSRVEEGDPYALFGDFPVGSYYSGTLTIGTHTLSATPYSGAGGTGAAGAGKTVTFTVTA